MRIETFISDSNKGFPQHCSVVSSIPEVESPWWYPLIEFPQMLVTDAYVCECTHTHAHNTHV